MSSAADMDMGMNMGMNMAMHQMDADNPDSLDQAQKPDCCLDDETALRTGQQCKHDQSCHAGQGAMAVASEFWVSDVAHLHVASVDMPFKPLLSLVAIWRPPSLI